MNAPDWKAHWIWLNKSPFSKNIRCLARHTFEVPESITSGTLYISADSRYRLYLDGEWLGDGPARSFPHHQQYDRYDILSRLTPGTHTLAIRVVHYGKGTFQYIPGRPALLCQIDMETDGTVRSIGSNHQWRATHDPAFEALTPRISCQMPFEEQFDARRQHLGWTEPGFDDTTWSNAREIGPVGTPPWTELEPRTIPFLTRTPVQPSRIAETSYVRAPRLVETVDVKETLQPGDISSNRQDYRGIIVTEIHSPVRQSARLPRQYSMLLGPWTLNQTLVDHPSRQPVHIELEQGANLFVASLVGNHHYDEFTLALETEQPVSIRAPFDGKGKWLIVGPLDPDPERAEQQARELTTLEGLQQVRDLWTMTSAGQEEIETDVWNVCFGQQTRPGTPAIKDAHHLLSDTEEWTVIDPSEEDVEILIDFGRMVVGYTEFEVDAADGQILDFNCFEAINDGVRQETYSNRNAFRYITRAGRQSYITEWRRGYRYIALNLRNLTHPLRIRTLNTRLSTYPAVEEGAFSCSDMRLNEIWRVGRYTLLCCMEDTFTDCPTYEQTYWVGDARNEALIAYSAYGAWPLVRRCATLPAQSLYNSPLPESQVPSAWKNILTAWSLLWIQMVEEHWMATGDTLFLHEIYPAVTRTLEACKGFCENDTGLMKIKAWNMFDWAGMDWDHELVTHNNLFLVEALRRAERLAGELGKDSDQQDWQQFRNRLIRRINEVLWSDEKKGYIDSIHDDGTPSEVVSQQTNTLALLYDVAPPERARIIQPYLTEPPEDMVTFGSPFAMFYLLEMLAREHHFDEMLEIIRSQWGFMLDAGATTFWETFPGFEVDVPTRSHCHAWSSAPTYFMSRYQLGVSPVQPGFKRVDITPQFVDLEWASGRIPTPHGNIKMGWQRDDERLDISVSLPAAVSGSLTLPRPHYDYSLHMNGRMVAEPTAPEEGIIWKDDSMIVELDAGQELDITILKL